jgi:hypothetical protein
MGRVQQRPCARTSLRSRCGPGRQQLTPGTRGSQFCHGGSPDASASSSVNDEGATDHVLLCIQSAEDREPDRVQPEPEDLRRPARFGEAGIQPFLAEPAVLVGQRAGVRGHLVPEHGPELFELWAVSFVSGGDGQGRGSAHTRKPPPWSAEVSLLTDYRLVQPLDRYQDGASSQLSYLFAPPRAQFNCSWSVRASRASNIADCCGI